MTTFPSFFFVLFRYLPICVFLLSLGMAQAANDWHLVKYNGQDFVTMDDVQRFYGFGTIERNGSKCTMRSVRNRIEYTQNSRELLINGIKFILSSPVYRVNENDLLARMDLTKLLEPVLRPSKIRGAQRVSTVVLDAGHGGHDFGAQSPFGPEKAYALDVVLRIRKILIGRGYRVQLTRSYDRFIPLEERPAFAARFKNSIFICIHFNAGSAAATGFETYTLAPRYVPSFSSEDLRYSDTQFYPGNFCDPENMALATAMHASLLKKLPMYDRGIKRARFVVLKDCTVPAVLVEGGFLSNFREAAQIATEGYRQRMALAIAEGVENYQAAIMYQSGREQIGPPPGTSPTSTSNNPNDEPVVVVPRANP